jgi:hypothetical protein
VVVPFIRPGKERNGWEVKGSGGQRGGPLMALVR